MFNGIFTYGKCVIIIEVIFFKQEIKAFVENRVGKKYRKKRT